MAEKEMLSENFSTDELECSCCHKLIFDANLIRLLQRLRNYVNKPVNVTSGYRCEKHNDDVGGVKNSYHAQGKAADIYVDGMSVDDLAQLCILCGFMGVGLYRKQKFVHVDVRDIPKDGKATVFYG